MKITFILTGSAHRPVGGFKVVYEYANRLVSDGHDVVLIHPQMVTTPKSITQRSLRTLLYIQRKLFRAYSPSNWFNLDPDIDVKWVLFPSQHNIPDSDIIIATGWNTAHFVAGLAPSSGDKYYLIQHLETWATNDSNAVLKTWRLPLKKIVIAGWLQDYATSIGELSCYVPNGLDFNAFGVDVPIEERDPCTVMLLNHWRPYKGSKDGLVALQNVKKHIPELRAVMFGIANAPPRLPDWVEYHRNPRQDTLRELYNRASIFIAPSHTEGWGLTACEAMMSGCALVATNVGGHREFAIHNQTSLLVPPNDVNTMANSVIRLIHDPELLLTLSRNASCYIKKFTWEFAYGKFLATLEDFDRCQ